MACDWAFKRQAAFLSGETLAEKKPFAVSGWSSPSVENGLTSDGLTPVTLALLCLAVTKMDEFLGFFSLLVEDCLQPELDYSLSLWDALIDLVRPVLLLLSRCLD